MMESLKQQIQVDMEKPFREKVAEIDGELDKSRSDYKKLKYDYTFLKLEFEHQSAEHKRVVNEMTLRYEAEVSAIDGKILQQQAVWPPDSADTVYLPGTGESVISGAGPPGWGPSIAR